MSEPTEEDEGHFYGVYLLRSQSDNPKFRNQNYIGFTVNPNRRLVQHNRGNLFGGARKTSDRGPWLMVVIVHGFPNNISALRFEWAWQQPKESRRLKHLTELRRRRPGESAFDLNFRILTEMLRVPPWNRLALTVRWLAPEYAREFPDDKMPPSHILIRSGHILLNRKRAPTTAPPTMSQRPSKCMLCARDVAFADRAACANSECALDCHLICLSERFLEPSEYVPVMGSCPKCRQMMLWADVVRTLKGHADVQIDSD